MKKRLLAVLLPLCASIGLQSDMIPPDSHIVEKCLRFTGFDKHPELVLVAVINSPGDDRILDVITLKDNDCAYKGYKFNRIRFYVLKKSSTEQCPSLKCIDFDKLSETQDPVFVEDCYGGTASNKTGLEKEISEYRVAAVNDSAVIVYKSQVTKIFGDREERTQFKKPSI